MVTRAISRPWRAFTGISMAILLALPAQASTPVPLAAMADGVSDAEFGESFAEFEALPELEAASHAVNIAAIEPAIEAEPEGRSLGSGVASYYAAKFHGRRTASGETFDLNGMTAAHRTLPFGTKVRVINPRTGASVIVRINDRGPFTRGRTIDVSRAAAEQLGLIAAGHGTVELELLDS